jgi:uncharacterized protein YbjT (DUF2867 family)
VILSIHLTDNERIMTVLKSIITTLFFSIMLIMMPSFNSATADLTDEDELILVVGASGRTGSYVIKYLKQEGRNFIAMTSNKERATKKFSEKYNWVEADVKKSQSLDSIMVGVTKIISGLGANKFEGPNSPEYIDYGGTKNLINAAEKAGTVTQFIQMSSSGITHKDNPLNRFGNVLVWKLKGEDYIRSSSIVHTIIRAGGLTNEEAGFKGVRMQQGDYVAVNGGMTSRGNLAAICIEALSNQNAKNKTFEVFDDETIKPNTWQKTFSNLIPDEKQ